MSATDQSIRRAAVLRERVIHAFFGNPGCRELTGAGVQALGIDYRLPHAVWGEGFSLTHLLFIVVTGEVWMEEAGLGAKAGQLLIIPATAPKRLVTRNHSLVALWTHVSHIRSWRGLAGSPRVLACPGAQRIEEIYRGLIEDSLVSTPQTQVRCMHWSALVLSYLAGCLPGKNEEQQRRRRLDKVWQEAGARLHEEWTAARLAELAHLSPGHFHRQVRLLYGQCPLEILRRLRLERATGLLRTTGWTLDAIAAEVGYATGFALSNAFQKFLGQRPSDFRNA